MLTYTEREELNTSGGSHVANEEEMHDFCASRTFLVRPHAFDSGFEAEDDIDDWAHENDVGSVRDMDDEERNDYIAPTMPHQEASSRIASALKLTTEEDNSRDRASSPCDEGQRSLASKRAILGGILMAGRLLTSFQLPTKGQTNKTHIKKILTCGLRWRSSSFN